MTVQELIEKLNKVEDKERNVTLVVGDSATFKPIVFDNGSGSLYISDY
jgi:hypothetical protein